MNAELAARRYDNELIGYVGYFGPDECSIKAVHLSEIRLSSSYPVTITHVPIPADIDVARHRCPYRIPPAKSAQ